MTHGIAVSRYSTASALPLHSGTMWSRQSGCGERRGIRMFRFFREYRRARDLGFSLLSAVYAARVNSRC